MKKKLLILSLLGICAVSTVVNANANPGGLGGVVKPADNMDCLYDSANNRYICKKPK